MKLLKIAGEVFLILCWCVIITIGVVLIQERISGNGESNAVKKVRETEEQNTVISLDKMKEKYQQEINEYLDDLKIVTVDENTLQVSFVLKEEKDPVKKIPMLKKISSLVDSAKGRKISFKINMIVQNDSDLSISVYDCRIDSFSLPDFLIQPANEMLSSSVSDLLKKNEQVRLRDLYVVENQIILIGDVPKEVQKVWFED